MKITKAVFDLMPASFQKQFKPVDGDADSYDNGEEDAGGLKTALEKEKAAKVQAAKERDDFKTAAKAAEDAAKAAEAKKAAEGGDFTKIEESYKAQIAEANKKAAEAAERADNLTLTNHKETVIAALLPNFTSAKAGRAILESSMKVELVDNKPVVRFLDGAGNPTALDSDGFRKNLLADPDLKSILVASKGSGGGSTRSPGGGGSTSGDSKFNPVTASGKEMAEQLKAKYPDLAAGNDD